ncbi:riboflavin synthase subunit alpha [Neisseria sp. Ec49-e6-T10]|uniref:riboflavin synthase subunit alpha n=1 Tax=Neisseria sp. Ec49-e6-T10 TaxID=3140744 RepID=UPI003EB6D2EE
MFTGIIQGRGQIKHIEEKDQFRTHIVQFPSHMLSDLTIGASVAHNGCCLTITQVNEDLVAFDLMQETLKLTNLGQLKVGDWINLERAARFGDEIGGHTMSGHIMSTAQIDHITSTPTNKTVWFTVPEPLKKYIFTKGFIGIDGISLTIGQVQDNRFNVHLIPETLNRTNMGSCQIQDKVNIEIDVQTQAVVDTLERMLTSYIENNNKGV